MINHITLVITSNKWVITSNKWVIPFLINYLHFPGNRCEDNDMLHLTIYWSSEVQCNAQQCCARHFSAVQCSAVQYCAVQYIAMQCNAVMCIALHCSAVQCSAVQRSSVQYSEIQLIGPNLPGAVDETNLQNLPISPSFIPSTGWTNFIIGIHCCCCLVMKNISCTI